MGTLIDLTNKKFGRLLVVGQSHKNSRGELFWSCFCDCGNVLSVRGSRLRAGKSKSCGCYHKEVVKNLFTRHGMSGTNEDKIYRAMKDRCYNKNNKRYSSYGGRGINICDRWLGNKGFDTFIDDMGMKPFPSASIDRINNDEGYSPENCRWTDKITQAHNTRIRSDNTSGVKGVSFNKQRGLWNARLNYKNKSILNTFHKDFKEAVFSRAEAEKRIIEAHKND